MTEAEATRAKIDDRRNYFRSEGGKANYAAPSTGGPQWYRHVPMLLPNGDDVGVIAAWHMPGVFDGVTPAHMHQVRELASAGTYRAGPRSPDWIGGAVAEVLQLDVESDSDRRRIKTILKQWFNGSGVLQKVERRGDDRHVFVFVEPGDWNEP